MILSQYLLDFSRKSQARANVAGYRDWLSRGEKAGLEFQTW
ncbi:hypothetical protein HMPREF9176_2045 [Streptococcus downei F0415]|nr:hypothetical protein HMPREF9176_2045 [Streptococcus downei F0415]